MNTLTLTLLTLILGSSLSLRVPAISRAWRGRQGGAAGIFERRARHAALGLLALSLLCVHLAHEAGGPRPVFNASAQDELDWVARHNLPQARTAESGDADLTNESE